MSGLSDPKTNAVASKTDFHPRNTGPVVLSSCNTGIAHSIPPHDTARARIFGTQAQIAARGGRFAVITPAPDTKLEDLVRTGEEVIRCGGIPEITLRGDTQALALSAIRTLSSRGHITAVGTVLNADQAQAAISAGARVVVTPGFLGESHVEDLIHLCATTHGVIPVVGIGSKVEGEALARLLTGTGCNMAKVFPFSATHETWKNLAIGPLPSHIRSDLDGITFVPKSEGSSAAEVATVGRVLQRCYYMSSEPGCCEIPEQVCVESDAQRRRWMSELHARCGLEFVVTGGIVPENVSNSLSCAGVAGFGASLKPLPIEAAASLTQLYRAAGPRGIAPVIDLSCLVVETGNDGYPRRVPNSLLNGALEQCEANMLVRSPYMFKEAHFAEDGKLFVIYIPQGVVTFTFQGKDGPFEVNIGEGCTFKCLVCMDWKENPISGVVAAGPGHTSCAGPKGALVITRKFSNHAFPWLFKEYENLESLVPRRTGKADAEATALA